MNTRTLSHYSGTLGDHEMLHSAPGGGYINVSQTEQELLAPAQQKRYTKVHALDFPMNTFHLSWYQACQKSQQNKIPQQPPFIQWKSINSASSCCNWDRCSNSRANGGHFSLKPLQQDSVPCWQSVKDYCICVVLIIYCSVMDYCILRVITW